jgi:hypothetical protein
MLLIDWLAAQRVAEVLVEIEVVDPVDARDGLASH